MMSSLRILIVDDEPDIARIAKMMAMDIGYVARVVERSADFEPILSEWRPTVILLDIIMPERDGFETLAAFRKNFPRTRILVISGDSKRTRGDYLQSAQMVGADATLRKPVPPEELLRVISELLKKV